MVGKELLAGYSRDMMRCMRYVLGLDKHSFEQKLVLDVGMGIGGIADGVAHMAECEVVGMDLGYAVDAARHYFGSNRRLHFVQASLFAPPFRPDTFDIAYSQVVLHHTYSTKSAFQSVSKLPRSQGGMLCVWVYSIRREKVTWFRRLLMSIEKLIRPALSRLPGALQTALLLPTLPLYVAYQNLYCALSWGRKIWQPMDGMKRDTPRARSPHAAVCPSPHIRRSCPLVSGR